MLSCAIRASCCAFSWASCSIATPGSRRENAVALSSSLPLEDARDDDEHDDEEVVEDEVVPDRTATPSGINGVEKNLNGVGGRDKCSTTSVRTFDQR